MLWILVVCSKKEHEQGKKTTSVRCSIWPWKWHRPTANPMAAWPGKNKLGYKEKKAYTPPYWFFAKTNRAKKNLGTMLHLAVKMTPANRQPDGHGRIADNTLGQGRWEPLNQAITHPAPRGPTDLGVVGCNCPVSGHPTLPLEGPSCIIAITPTVFNRIAWKSSRV